MRNIVFCRACEIPRACLGKRRRIDCNFVAAVSFAAWPKGEIVGENETNEREGRKKNETGNAKAGLKKEERKEKQKKKKRGRRREREREKFLF